MMADDYAALLDTLKIDSAYVIGWSDGGIVRGRIKTSQQRSNQNQPV
jgi:hypothetical protein